MRIVYLLALVPAVVGVVLGAISYFTPDSGVDGTPGALLALVGAVCVALGSLIAMTTRLGGWASWTLNGLIGLGALLTAIAAWFLMQDPFAIAMVTALVGLTLALALNKRRTAA